ncbi:MAG: aminotransferase [Acidovorax sp.]
MLETTHGGPDALGVPPHDFSTNANACGPCPTALAALRQAEWPFYPDPAYTALRARLGAWHGVDVQRVVVAASGSEFIQRITAHAARSGLRHVALPRHGYGDYARAARAWGLEPPCADEPALHWACEPSSPLGAADASLRQGARGIRVVDCAYAPLRLEGEPAPLPADAWQLWSPNKALGLTGVRAAYAIAPAQATPATLADLHALAPSWPLGADGVALLDSWTRPATQAWLAESRATLRAWKAAQIALCEELGWAVLPGSLANFFTARLRVEVPLAALRARGIKLRDCASFGLPGHVRLGVLPPASQQALRSALGA